MQTISFEMPYGSVVLKTTNKFIRVFRCQKGSLMFTDMTCPHRGGPLTHGIENEEFIVCPWHKQKTKKCRIQSLDIPYVENGKTILIGIQGVERFIKET
ncbi:Rieske 2Fe-2S domain-containing protein [Klebsiella michiganensis]|uniref:Rieske 2Fe-2S domain-containing protein n=1 Tax=Klebsiella michiganensis TaxID=1134687 RepID=UPI0032DA1D12